MKKIAISTETIQLDQFLKLTGAINSGGVIKALLAEKSIIRNGQIESARRRKLRHGDIIEIIDGGIWQVEAIKV